MSVAYGFQGRILTLIYLFSVIVVLTIEEFNLKIEAEEELKALEEAAKAKEEEEKEKEKANTVVLRKEDYLLYHKVKKYNKEGKKIIIE